MHLLKGRVCSFLVMSAGCATPGEKATLGFNKYADLKEFEILIKACWKSSKCCESTKNLAKLRQTLTVLCVIYSSKKRQRLSLFAQV